jgi:chromosome segregation ATPase
LIRSLQEQLAQKNAELTNLKQQMGENQQMFTEEGNSQLQRLQEQKTEYERQIANLNTQIANIQEANRKLQEDGVLLKQMVDKSYQAIGRAGKTLGLVQKQQINEAEFRKLLGDIYREVEQIKTDLNNLLSGASSSTGSSSSSSSSATGSSSSSSSKNTGGLPLTTNIIVNFDDGGTETITLGEIIDALTDKDNTSSSGKYGNIVLEINNMNNVNNIENYLDSQGITFKAGAGGPSIVGGRKSKKTKNTRRRAKNSKPAKLTRRRRRRDTKN